MTQAPSGSALSSKLVKGMVKGRRRGVDEQWGIGLPAL
jgi:hypothetical protein